MTDINPSKCAPPHTSLSSEANVLVQGVLSAFATKTLLGAQQAAISRTGEDDAIVQVKDLIRVVGTNEGIPLCGFAAEDLEALKATVTAATNTSSSVEETHLARKDTIQRRIIALQRESKSSSGGGTNNGQHSPRKKQRQLI